MSSTAMTRQALSLFPSWSYLILVAQVALILTSSSTSPPCLTQGFVLLPVPTRTTKRTTSIFPQPPPPQQQRHGHSSFLSTKTTTSLNGAAVTMMSTVTKGVINVLRAGARAAQQTPPQNLAIVASGGAGDVAGIVVEAYEWCTNLGNPSALVAGAVIATIYENFSSGDLDIIDSDNKWIKLGKRMTRVLLLSAFASEVLSIFVTTVTGTMLLSSTLDCMDEIVPVAVDTTPLQFLKENFEFEYLTARITFVQGLFNWLAAIGLGHIVPNTARDEKKSERPMNLFIGLAMFSSIGLMISFYNRHMNFYSNLGHMWIRWFVILMQRFFFCRPIQPMLVFYLPSVIGTLYFGLKAFLEIGDSKNNNDNNSGGSKNKEINSSNGDQATLAA